MPDITYDVGRVSFVMKGAWNLATAYEKLDAVTYDGSLYIAKQDVPGGTAITNTTYWQLAVEKGDQGETGNGIASITLTGTAGNVDTYTITFTDGTTTTFTVTNGGVTTVNGRTGDVTGLAEEDGSYPLLNAGTADNLTPYSEDSGATQDIPFIAQGTGCGNGESVVDTGSYLQFKKKLGNTVGVNDLWGSANGTITMNGIALTYDKSTNELTVVVGDSPTGYAQLQISTSPASIIPGRKYIIASDKPIESGMQFYASGMTGLKGNVPARTQFTIEAGTSATSTLYFFVAQTTTPGTYKYKLQWRDLSIWYGSTDRIPSDLLSHPENWGRYYAGSLAYNAGTLESADGTVLKSIGRNVWDEEWEVGGINLSTGQNASANNKIRSTNYVPVIPNTAYYAKAKLTNGVLFYGADKTYLGIDYAAYPNNSTFTTPPNAYYMRFVVSDTYGTTYNHDLTISLYYSGESGYDQYYPYSVLAEVDTGSEVLRSAGAVADEKTPDGTITRRVGYVDMGTLSFETATANGKTYSNIISDIQKGSASGYGNFIQSAIFVGVEKASMGLLGDGEMSVDTGGRLQICKTAWANYTSAQIATALSGVYLYYELATPTTEQGTAFAENIPCDDFGSMYWTQTKGIPQGNEIFYPVDYKASIDTLYNRVGGDMSKIVTEDEYPEAPSSDGTYVLKATVSGGTKTYAWVAE